MNIFVETIKKNPLVWATLFFIVFDIITGILKTIKLKNFSSAAAKRGLFSKTGYIIMIIFSNGCEFFQSIVDYGFHIPLTAATCTMIIYTEAISILENISVLSPTLKDTLDKVIAEEKSRHNF